MPLEIREKAKIHAQTAPWVSENDTIRNRIREKLNISQSRDEKKRHVISKYPLDVLSTVRKKNHCGTSIG